MERVTETSELYSVLTQFHRMLQGRVMATQQQDLANGRACGIFDWIPLDCVGHDFRLLY
jgi:hypothetical protein